MLSNIWDWEPVKLIEWHREKAGTIERAHDVLKNGDRSAAVEILWGQRRLVAAGGDLLQRADGPEPFGVARRFIEGPRSKRLRFLIFYTVGRLVHHARQLRLRLAREAEGIVLWWEALRFLPLRT